MTTVTRRNAIRTTGLAALAASLIGTTKSAVAGKLADPMDRAEALLAEVEAILLCFPGGPRADLGDELKRLHTIAGAADPRKAAAAIPSQAGANRYSIFLAEAHALAHASIIPTYGHLIARAVQAGQSRGLNFRASKEAEEKIAESYAAPKAADIERYGRVGEHAWDVARSAASFGYCEHCAESA